MEVPLKVLDLILTSLFYMAPAFIVLGLTIGIIAFLLARTRKKDRQLSRNVLITIVLVCIIWFSVPLILTIVDLIPEFRESPATAISTVPAVLLLALNYSIVYLIPGAISGLVLAFAIVAPVTLLVRRFRPSMQVEDPSP